MERLIRYGSVDSIPFYNCSWKSSEEWIEEGLKRPYLGWFLTIFGITVEGAVFCTYPTFEYIAGGFAINTWCMACAITISLFANRVCSIAFQEYADVIEGKLTYASMLISTVYGGWILFFTPIICFNSKGIAWLSEPLSEKEPSEEAAAYYNNDWQFWNNWLFVAIMGILYTTYCILVKKLARGQKSKTSKAIFIQCAVICFFNTVTALVYNAFSIVPTDQWILYMGQLAWSINHGCPAIIYLTMNETIKREFRRTFLRQKISKVDPQKSMTSTAANTMHI